jgi:hypothetical protein
MPDPKQYYHNWYRYWEIAALRGRYISVAQAGLSEQQLSCANNDYTRAQQRDTFGRRFFTSKNVYLGLCYSLSRAGDAVVVLQGGRTPLVLRKRGAKY